MRRTAAVIIALATSILLRAQGVPRKVDEIPLYKGFVRDQSRDEAIVSSDVRNLVEEAKATRPHAASPSLTLARSINSVLM